MPEVRVELRGPARLQRAADRAQRDLAPAGPDDRPIADVDHRQPAAVGGLAAQQAHQRGATLPPISVVAVGDEYVLRDGHHRVSVAIDHGRSEIEAEVVELGQRQRISTGEPTGTRG